MPTAEHEHTRIAPAAPMPDRSAATDDFDKALDEAQVVNRIIAAIAEGSLSDNQERYAGLYSWLSDYLHSTLERIELAGMTMRRA